MFLAIISPSSYSWNDRMSAIFIFTTKTTQPRLQVFSVKGALTCMIQGGKTFCASFCASLIAGSRRAFPCVDCVRQIVFLSMREFWLRLNEMHKVWTFASRKAFLLLCGFCFSSLENYFGLGTTNVKGKTDHSVSLRWNKEFWTFPKRRVFFWLFIRFICELISPSFAGLN